MRGFWLLALTVVALAGVIELVDRFGLWQVYFWSVAAGCFVAFGFTVAAWIRGGNG